MEQKIAKIKEHLFPDIIKLVNRDIKGNSVSISQIFEASEKAFKKYNVYLNRIIRDLEATIKNSKFVNFDFDKMVLEIEKDGKRYLITEKNKKLIIRNLNDNEIVDFSLRDEDMLLYLLESFRKLNYYSSCTYTWIKNSRFKFHSSLEENKLIYYLGNNENIIFGKLSDSKEPYTKIENTETYEHIELNSDHMLSLKCKSILERVKIEEEVLPLYIQKEFEKKKKKSFLQRIRKYGE